MSRRILAPVQIFLVLFLLALFLLAEGVAPAHAQASPATASSSGEVAAGDSDRAKPESGGAKPEQQKSEAGKSEAGESESESNDVYRHSSAVQYVARILNLSVETTAKIFEYLNFAILAGSILFFVFKLVPKMLRGRREALAKQLVDARSAAEEAKQKLGSVEDRLSRLDDEIAAIRKQVEQDAAQDEVRMKAALEEEKKRIAEAAGQEVEAVGAAAQRELRRFAAELAIEHASKSLSLTAEMDRRLVSNFAGEIAGDAARGARN